MVQLSATRRSCVSLVSFAAINLRVASQRVFIFVVYFVIDSVRKLLDTSLYIYFNIIYECPGNIKKCSVPRTLREAA
jgi:hypothetical protein